MIRKERRRNLEYLYLLAPIVFSVLWFLNLVQLLEKLKAGRNIHNQKVLGCVWSAGLTFSLMILLAISI